MRPPIAAALAAISALLGAAGSRAEDPARNVLVELYTSQGCDSCPPASDLLGRLAVLGYGPDRVVPVDFHVDYFNDPWADPFADREFSRRQAAYNTALKRQDLYFTPMMMVDGRVPLLGSDRAKALAAIDRARKEPPSVSLNPSLEGSGDRKTLTVKLAARSPRVAGRELLVGVAVTEDPVSTAVASGENAGKTLVEHHVVRSYLRQQTRLAPSVAKSLEFSPELRPGQAAAHTTLAVFVQDETGGQVYQARAIPWLETGRPR